jgi:hypothetical protein
LAIVLQKVSDTTKKNHLLPNDSEFYFYIQYPAAFSIAKQEKNAGYSIFPSHKYVRERALYIWYSTYDMKLSGRYHISAAFLSYYKGHEKYNPLLATQIQNMALHILYNSILSEIKSCGIS